MRGTHQGTFLGVAPTGKKIEVKAMNFYRLSDGQIVEEHGLLGLDAQLLERYGVIEERDDG